MLLQRNDVVTVAAPGDFGKPRPAVIIQSDVFPEFHSSVILCPLTSTLANAPEFRVTVVPSEMNGLRLESQIMVDKIVTVRRDRLGEKIGRLSAQEIRLMNMAIAFVTGLSD